MNEQSGREHDAVLRVFDSTVRLGRKIIAWRWADGRCTLTPDEHEETARLIEEAEGKIDPSDLDHGTVVAHVWMEDGSAVRVEWDGRYLSTDSDGPRGPE